MVPRLLIAIAFLTTVVGISHGISSADPSGEELGITEKEKDMLTEAADKKARDLGFNPERSHFRLTKEKSLFKADYWPKEKKGEIRYGGNLTLYLNRKGHTVRVEASP